MSRNFVAPSLFVACAFVSNGCMFSGLVQGVRGSGRGAVETRRISTDFTKISEDIPANVEVQVGGATSIKIEGDDNILPLVKTTIEDGTLFIGSRKPIRENRKLVVTITLPALEAVSLNGAGNMNVSGIQGDTFAVSLDGSGNITLGGSTNSLSASLDGTGNLNLEGLQSSEASVSVDGAGNVDLWAAKSLNASLNGVGNIRYKGEPSVTQSINGVGRVERL